MERRKQIIGMRAYLALGLLLLVSFTAQIAIPAYETGQLFISQKWIVAVGAAVIAILLLLALLVLSLTGQSDRITGVGEMVQALLRKLDWRNMLVVLAGIIAYDLLIAGPLGYRLDNQTIRFSIFGLVALACYPFIRATWPDQPWLRIAVASGLFLAFGYEMATYAPQVSTNPFSLSWSEASRYYYASLFLSERIYGIAVPPTVLHPTRYLLQAIPFLIPNSPIVIHRLWQVLLWIIITFITASALSRHIRIPERLVRWSFVAWAFLFILLGPVYYHLQVILILVLLTYDQPRFGRTLFGVLLASLWAGISRVNWFPVPGLLASSLYLLAAPVKGQPLWRYLAKPLVYSVAGVGAAFASQALYAIWSGNPAEQFASSLSSNLLWYRLFPNPTYGPGILPASLIVSLPLILLTLGCLMGSWRAYHPIRVLGVVAILAVFFAGGLIVSTKIGGGSNLHNLDAFFAILLVVASQIYFGNAVGEDDQAPSLVPGNWLFRIGLAFTLLVPVYYTVRSGSYVKPYDRALVAQAIDDLSQKIDRRTAEGGEVLFITERQLLTFGQIKGVQLVPDYEKVFLMEMAMAGNSAYLNRLYTDLAQKKYALVVIDPVFIRYKGDEFRFGEENDAWVEKVAEPLLCYYEVAVRWSFPAVHLLAPRDTPGQCPYPVD